MHLLSKLFWFNQCDIKKFILDWKQKFDKKKIAFSVAFTVFLSGWNLLSCNGGGCILRGDSYSSLVLNVGSLPWSIYSWSMTLTPFPGTDTVFGVQLKALEKASEFPWLKFFNQYFNYAADGGLAQKKKRLLSPFIGYLTQCKNMLSSCLYLIEAHSIPKYDIVITFRKRYDWESILGREWDWAFPCRQYHMTPPPWI